ARLQAGTETRAIIHAQPLHLTALSHSPEFAEEDAFSRALYVWQPETIVAIPEGIGFVPYKLPGSVFQEEATVKKMLSHRIVVWAKHGVIAADADLMKAFDLIDYSEAAAKYCILNRSAGLNSPGLSAENLKKLCGQFNVESSVPGKLG
ncbi:MAG: class II aldolase/adducin family protein, partial [Planctomycetota bacterium]|nr:class II aldolase/adducin family protein [Planctomycetota bacterium]